MSQLALHTSTKVTIGPVLSFLFSVFGYYISLFLTTFLRKGIYHYWSSYTGKLTSSPVLWTHHDYGFLL